MAPSLPLKCSLEVADALAAGKPVVALESTIIAHGLPHPENAKTAKLLEQTIRDRGAVPATIAVLEGVATAGLNAAELAHITNPNTEMLKLSRRDLPFAFSQNRTGATTVATTMLIAASKALLRTRALLACRLAPSVICLIWSSKNGVRALPLIDFSYAKASACVIAASILAGSI